MGFSIHNKTTKTWVFPLGKDMITLSPNNKVGETATISDEHINHPDILRLIKKGFIEIIDNDSAEKIETKNIEEKPKAKHLEFEVESDNTTDISSSKIVTDDSGHINVVKMPDSPSKDIKVESNTDTPINEESVSQPTTEPSSDVSDPVEVPVETDPPTYQCNGITASGSQCQRMVKMTPEEYAANGEKAFCPQHTTEDK